MLDFGSNLNQKDQRKDWIRNSILDYNTGFHLGINYLATRIYSSEISLLITSDDYDDDTSDVFKISKHSHRTFNTFSKVKMKVGTLIILSTSILLVTKLGR